jgi:SAM-dependent methyltransferase
MLRPAQKIALERLPNDKRIKILEVGFGTGEFLQELWSRGYNAYGTEISQKMVDQVGGQTTCSFDPQIFHIDFDIVYLFETLEHQKNPVKFLQELPGKKLIGSIPNVERFSVKLAHKYEKWDFPPNHLHRFSSIELVNLLLKARYTDAKAKATWVEPTDILGLRNLYFGRNTEDYDDMRGKHSLLKEAIKLGTLPITWPLAELINVSSLQGPNIYFEATR